MKRLILGALCAVIGTVGAVMPLWAQSWLTQTIPISVPFASGGSDDIRARLLASELQKRLKQSVINERRAGSGGYVGVGVVARAKPDGYKLVLSSVSGHVFAKSTKRDANYDPRKAFEAIGLINDLQLVLNVSLADLIKTGSARPEGLFFGSIGTGSSTHCAGELFAAKTVLKLTHVPYPGPAADA